MRDTYPGYARMRNTYPGMGNLYTTRVWRPVHHQGMVGGGRLPTWVWWEEGGYLPTWVCTPLYTTLYIPYHTLPGTPSTSRYWCHDRACPRWQRCTLLGSTM